MSLEKSANRERLLLNYGECFCWHLSGKSCKSNKPPWRLCEPFKKALGVLKWSLTMECCSKDAKSATICLLPEPGPVFTRWRAAWLSDPCVFSEVPQTDRFPLWISASFLQLHTAELPAWTHRFVSGHDVTFKRFHSLRCERTSIIVTHCFPWETELSEVMCLMRRKSTQPWDGWHYD